MSGIVIAGVSRTFGTVRAVDNVDLTVEEGEFFTLLGPVGLRQDHPAAHDRRLLRARQRRDPLRRARASTGCRRIVRDIGMVFQNYAVFPNLTVAGNVAYGLKARRVPAGRERRAGSTRRWRWSSSRATASASRTSSRAASCSASRSRARW